jgi:hypothetical protein
MRLDAGVGHGGGGGWWRGVAAHSPGAAAVVEVDRRGRSFG